MCRVSLEEMPEFAAYVNALACQKQAFRQSSIVVSIIRPEHDSSASRGSPRPFRLTIDDSRFTALKNYPPVAGAARDALAVEVFEERDGVLARDAGDFLEGGHVDEALGRVARGVLAQGGDEGVD